MFVLFSYFRLLATQRDDVFDQVLLVFLLLRMVLLVAVYMLVLLVLLVLLVMLVSVYMLVLLVPLRMLLLVSVRMLLLVQVSIWGSYFLHNNPYYSHQRLVDVRTLLQLRTLRTSLVGSLRTGEIDKIQS